MTNATSIDSLTGLLAFVTTVEAGGFAAASRKLGISASAVGKAVARLEARSGVSLLQRTTRSIAMTGEGELLYERSSQILRDIHEAENLISNTRATPSGRLKISLPTVMGRLILVPALPQFLEQYPEIELDLWIDDRKVDVVGEGYDVVVRLGELDDSGLVARKVGPHRFITCASPSYIEKYGTPETPSDLVEHRCVRYRFPSTGLIEQWMFKGKAKPPALGTGLVFNDGEALAVAAEAGFGIVQAPSYLVTEQVASGALVPLLENVAANRGHIWIIWPPERTNVPRVRHFVDFVRNTLLHTA